VIAHLKIAIPSSLSDTNNQDFYYLLIYFYDGEAYRPNKLVAADVCRETKKINLVLQHFWVIAQFHSVERCLCFLAQSNFG
jgi:hypothetical protein